MVAIDARWLDCKFDPDHLTDQAAHVILKFHQHETWRPCIPQVAALAYLGNPDAYEWE